MKHFYTILEIQKLPFLNGERLSTPPLNFEKFIGLAFIFHFNDKKCKIKICQKEQKMTLKLFLPNFFKGDFEIAVAPGYAWFQMQCSFGGLLSKYYKTSLKDLSPYIFYGVEDFLSP